MAKQQQKHQGTEFVTNSGAGLWNTAKSTLKKNPVPMRTERPEPNPALFKPRGAAGGRGNSRAQKDGAAIPRWPRDPTCPVPAGRPAGEGGGRDGARRGDVPPRTGAGGLGTADVTPRAHPALGRDAAGCSVRTGPEGGDLNFTEVCTERGTAAREHEDGTAAARRDGARGPPHSALPRRLRAGPWGSAWYRGSRVGRGGARSWEGGARVRGGASAPRAPGAVSPAAARAVSLINCTE